MESDPEAPVAPRDGLAGLVATELDRPAPAAARVLSDAIVARHGDCVAAVLFYGSCLRRDSHEGVLDFYVLVDSYRSAYGAGWLALAGAVLPPNVLYLERETPELGLLRTKYAMMSLRDFEKATEPSAPHPYIWARFAQPALLSYARDAETRQAVECAVAGAVRTFVQRLVVFLPARAGTQRFSLAALWQTALRRTYGAELRAESRETIRGVYDADPDRYDRAARLALEDLADSGWIGSVDTRGAAVAVEMPTRRRLLGRLRWWGLWPIAKGLALLRLFKTATTFGDWLPYVLFKLERHTGEHLVPSERQRRHPLVFGWPVILKLLARRSVR